MVTLKNKKALLLCVFLLLPLKSFATPEKYHYNSSMAVLCHNYYKEFVKTEGSTLYITGFDKIIIQREEDVKLVLRGVYVTNFGVELEISVGCYVKNTHQPGDHYNFNDIVLFEQYTF